MFDRPDWHLRARCRGDMFTKEFGYNFFPERGDSKKVSIRARKFCEGCEVIDECLHYALRNNITEGVWGGTIANDRRELRKTHGYYEPPT